MFEVGCNENATGNVTVKCGGSSAKARVPSKDSETNGKHGARRAGGIKCNFFAQAAANLLESTFAMEAGAIAAGPRRTGRGNDRIQRWQDKKKKKN